MDFSEEMINNIFNFINKINKKLFMSHIIFLKEKDIKKLSEGFSIVTKGFCTASFFSEEDKLPFENEIDYKIIPENGPFLEGSPKRFQIKLKKNKFTEEPIDHINFTIVEELFDFLAIHQIEIKKENELIRSLINI